MNLSIPADAEARLRTHAAAAGYADVERYVTDYVMWLSESSPVGELTPPTDKALAASVAMCDRGVADGEAGKGRPAAEVFSHIAGKYGLPDPTTT